MGLSLFHLMFNVINKNIFFKFNFIFDFIFNYIYIAYYKK